MISYEILYEIIEQRIEYIVYTILVTENNKIITIRDSTQSERQRYGYRLHNYVSKVQYPCDKDRSNIKQ